ncbi:MAG: radical SAM protein [Nanoarchaeota archaeon]|nr:B12-binding domain-containing radical SAM protein [Nanoarchaeota archaeon]
MKILLINPNHIWSVPTDAYLTKGQLKLRRINPPLGLAILASIARTKHEVKIVEANALNLTLQQVINIVEEFHPDIIGMTAFYSTRESTKELAKKIRKRGFKQLLIVGGADPTAEPENYVDFFDIVAVGEGEETFKEILEHKPLKEINGLCYLKNNQIVYTNPRKLIKNLDLIPTPAWDLLPIKKYKPETLCIKYKLPFMLMMTSRGCPHNCSYCAANVLFPKFRQKSLKKIMKEIKELYYRYKIRTITFGDSTFTINKSRVKKLCNFIIKNNIKIRWNIETRADSLDYDLLRIMKQAGCYYINLGVQTFQKEALKKIHRLLFFDKVAEIVSNCKKIGIITRLEFILGLPTETKESMRNTFQKANELNPDFVSYYPLISLPKTELTKAGYQSPYSKKELEELAIEGYKQFYFRVNYILSRFKHLWNPIYVKRYLECFINFN